MSDLDHLAQLLRRRFVAASASTTLAQSDPTLLARLAATRQRLVPPRGHRSTARIAQGVMAFRLAGTATGYPALKYACYGVARPMDWEGRLLLGEERQLARLLDAVDALRPHPRQFAACCRGLLAAWHDDIAGGEAPLREQPALQPGIVRLHAFLQAAHAELRRQPALRQRERQLLEAFGI
jgi:hypothetical protein